VEKIGVDAYEKSWITGIHESSTRFATARSGGSCCASSWTSVELADSPPTRGTGFRAEPIEWAPGRTRIIHSHTPVDQVWPACGNRAPARVDPLLCAEALDVSPPASGHALDVVPGLGVEAEPAPQEVGPAELDDHRPSQSKAPHCSVERHRVFPEP